MLEDFLRRQSPDLSIGEMGVLIAKVKAYFVGSLPEAFADELIRNGADYFAALGIIPPRHAALSSCCWAYVVRRWACVFWRRVLPRVRPLSGSLKLS